MQYRDVSSWAESSLHKVFQYKMWRRLRLVEKLWLSIPELLSYHFMQVRWGLLPVGGEPGEAGGQLATRDVDCLANSESQIASIISK